MEGVSPHASGPTSGGVVLPPESSYLHASRFAVACHDPGGDTAAEVDVEDVRSAVGRPAAWQSTEALVARSWDAATAATLIFARLYRPNVRDQLLGLQRLIDRRFGSCVKICRRLGATFDVWAVRDAEHASRRYVSGTIAEQRTLCFSDTKGEAETSCCERVFTGLMHPVHVPTELSMAWLPEEVVAPSVPTNLDLPYQAWWAQEEPTWALLPATPAPPKSHRPRGAGRGRRRGEGTGRAQRPRGRRT